MTQNFAAPVWMTFKQALELDAHIGKGEKGSRVVYADSIIRKEADAKTGDEIDRFISNIHLRAIKPRFSDCEVGFSPTLLCSRR